MSAYQNTKDMLSYLLREGGLFQSPILLLAVAASGSKTLMIYFINEAAERGGAGATLFAVLIGTVAVTLTTEHLARVYGAALVQDLAKKMRRDISEHVLNADVSFFQKRDFGQVYAALTGQTDTVATSIMRIVDLVQAVLLLLFCLIYMTLQSWPAGVATVAAFGLGVAAFLLAEGPARRVLDSANKARIAFYDAVNDTLRGHKELRLRQARRRDVATRIQKVTEDAAQKSVAAERYFSFGQGAATAALALLLVAIVSLLPLVATVDNVVILQVLTVVLFAFGPIEAVVSGLPAFARASVSYSHLKDVLAELDANPESEAARNAPDSRPDFKTIELRGVTVTLRRPSQAPGSSATDTFTLGPIDLALTPGQSVFITGGNGMGKSTLLQILTGLRHPDGGEILLDGEPVTRDTVGHFRGLFSAVFSEFYMFRQLYGLTLEERERLQAHIEELGLAEGVSIADDRFASLALSTGQMRRLALSIALAEERPIIVLDEFAADQDPVRRAFFYDVLVPRLSKAGHLVIAVTHDEHCFAKSDRLIRMEDGKVVSDSVQVASAPASRTG
ncbi:MAG: cyclic peptide export ABC transporter [Rhodobacter sp.]|nr:cyclic peptide export ABC transporter [Rhodobacter sp.]